jgi:hypothetical protein
MMMPRNFDSPVLADGYEVGFYPSATANLRPGTTDGRLVQMPFQDLSPLRTLDLSHTDVTDAGLTHLERLTQLQWLNLGGTKVTDSGLQHLKGLTELQRLLLDGTQVTDKGRAKLQKALPKCKIIWSPPTKDL